MTKVPDSLFPLPETINGMPCFSASRFLHRVPESLDIVSVCQDPNNPALVILTYTLNGVFEFQPYCRILRVNDQDWSTSPADAPFAAGHEKSPVLPITTNCSLLTDTIVFDFGAVIPLFLSVHTIEFELGMVGSLPMAFGVSFTPTTPTCRYTWTKGLLPTPVGISLINGHLLVQFDYQGDMDCSCDLQCITPTGVDQDISFCANQSQTVLIDHGPLTGAPATFTLSFEDAIGNSSLLSIQTVINVEPLHPEVFFVENPKRVEVSIPRMAANGAILDEVQYRVYRYAESDRNIELWRDWSDKPINVLLDYNVVPGRTYGYSVMYQGAYGDTTLMSPWATVSIPT